MPTPQRDGHHKREARTGTTHRKENTYKKLSRVQPSFVSFNPTLQIKLVALRHPFGHFFPCRIVSSSR
jgi:hypothetical protein